MSEVKSETKRRKKNKGKTHEKKDATQECQAEGSSAIVVKSPKNKKSHPSTLQRSKSLKRLKENTRKAKAKAKKTSVAESSTKDGQDQQVTVRKQKPTTTSQGSPDPSIQATSAVPRKGKETQDDKVRERKARISRKSAAYHAAKKKAVSEGLDAETATAKAREVFMAKLIIYVFFHIQNPNGN